MELHEIYLAALEYQNPQDRHLYLDRACQDRPEIRDQIEQMLRHGDRLDEFLETPACALPEVREALLGSQSDLQTELGARLQLFEQLGEGGMGSVWLARQTSPIDRMVAVKLLRPGLESKGVLARFHSERETLGRLQHPNIATIYDAGLTSDSRPFFVMEYCKGMNLAEYCNSKSLSLRQRIELVLPICRALSYVHDQGILHRDIKPSNVLIVDYDSQPTPKLIDFGIAKAIDQGILRETLESSPGALIGTPEFMAPELLCEESSHPTVESDVYSLGALIYQLLTSTPPYGKMGSNRTGLLEFLKRVQQADAPAPSVIVSDENPSQAGDLRGDLDWIVLKAIDRDPARRYRKVSDLQNDLQCFLDQKPVSAHPPSLLYRLGKFKQRHKIALYATCGLAGALLMSSLSLWWGWNQSILTSKQLNQADLRAKRLETAFLEDLRRDVKDSTDRLTRAAPDQKQAAREALRNLADRWQTLSENVDSDDKRIWVVAESNLRLGKIYSALGEPTAATEKFERAHELYHQIKPSENMDDSLVTQRIDSVAELARNLFDRGDVSRATELFSEGVRLTESRQHALNSLGDCEVFIDLYQDRAKVLIRSGKPTEAIHSIDSAFLMLDKLREISPDDSHATEKTISLRNTRANVLRASGKIDQAMEELSLAKQEAQKLSASENQSVYLQELLAIQHQQLGMMQQVLGRYPESLEELSLAKDLFKKLALAYRSLPDYQERLASATNALAVTAFLSGDIQQGIDQCTLAIDTWRSLADAGDPKPEYLKSQSEGEMNLGAMLSRAQRHDESIQALKRGIDTARKLSERFPDRLDFMLAYFRAHTVFAGAQRARGNMPESMSAITVSIDLFRDASKRFPESIELRDGMATALLTRGDYLLSQEEFEACLIDYESALEAIEKLPRKVAGQAYPRDLASVLVLCAKAHKELGHRSRCLECLEQAKDFVQNKYKDAPDDAVGLKSLQAIQAEISSLQDPPDPTDKPRA